MIKCLGKKVWEAFKNESGKHVVQRVPPTETKGRRQTSVVSVAILPIVDMNLYSLDEKDLEVKTQGGSGPGGQHRNKTDSAVRMKHKPTGLSVFIDGRKQLKNKQKALKILTSRVNYYYLEKKREKHSNDRQKQMGGGSRSGKVRTYNFIDSRVKNHLTGKETRNIEAVMKGDFELVH